MNKILSILILLFSWNILAGQFHPTITYTTRDGLSDAWLSSVYTDSRGVVWIGTTAGLSRFDGNSFSNFPTKFRERSSEQLTILEDPNGHIWIHERDPMELGGPHISVVGPSGRILHEFHFQELGIGPYKFFYDPYFRQVMAQDGTGSVWRFDPEEEAMIFLEKMEFGGDPIIALPVPDPYSNRWFLKHELPGRGDSFLLIRDPSGIRTIRPPEGYRPDEFTPLGFLPDGALVGKFIGAQFMRYREQEGWTPVSPVKVSEQGAGAGPCGDGFPLLIGLNPANGIGRIIEFSSCFPNGIEYPFRSEKTFESKQVARGKDGSFWIATHSGLIRIIPGFVDLTNNRSIALLINKHESCRMPFVPGRSPPFYRFLSSHRVLDTINSEIKTGVRSSEPGIFQIYHPNQYQKELGDTVYYLYRSFDGELAYGHHKKSLAIFPSPNCREDSCMIIVGPEQGGMLSSIQTVVKDPFGRWWMGKYVPESKPYFPEKELTVKDNPTGMASGISCYDPARDTVFNYPTGDGISPLGAMSAILDNRGNLWFGTNRGLAFYEVREMAASENPLQPGLFRMIGETSIGDDAVNALIQLDSNTLAIGTDRGLALLDLQAFYQGTALIRFLDNSRGFSGTSIERGAFWIDCDGGLWIGSDIGVHRFDPDNYAWDRRKPNVSIDSIWAGGIMYNELPEDRLLHLRTTDRSVRIYYGTEFDSLLQNTVTFRYKLSGDSLYSEPTRERVITFPHLGPGTYCVQVKAQRDGVESDPVEYCFRIPRPIYLRFWFWLTGLLLLGTLIRYYESNLGRQRAEKNKLQVQAIVNQLNPHFINNALQWVQVRVYNDREAVQVISRLGENIRIVFKNSRQNKAFHSLEDELRLVDNYLFVQKKRFGEKLEYELPDTEQITRLGAINVPLMQLQIHCENAVEHGIRNMEEAETGTVRLVIREEEEYLYVIIEDDGVGRRKAREIGSKGTQQGTKMLASMQEIFNRQNTSSLEFRYEDDIFENDRGEKYGTRVHILIPKQYKYELD